MILVLSLEENLGRLLSNKTAVSFAMLKENYELQTIVLSFTRAANKKMTIVNNRNTKGNIFVIFGRNILFHVTEPRSANFSSCEVATSETKTEGRRESNAALVFLQLQRI